MHPEDRDAGYVWDMLNATRKLLLSVKELSLADYLANEDLRLTVERRLEIMAEAARRISEEFKVSHPRFHGSQS